MRYAALVSLPLSLHASDSALIALNFTDRDATVPLLSNEEAAIMGGFTALAFFWDERRGSRLVAPSMQLGVGWVR